ncbi:MAG: TolC family protein [Spirochaetales bacterium]|nr:TolC family protein [Spirochaetales bacterium]
MKRVLLLTVSIVMTSFIFSEAIKIDEKMAIEMALENSLSLKKQRLTEKSALIDKETSYSALYPKVSVNSAIVNKNTASTTSVTTPMGTMDVEIPPTNLSLGFESSLVLTPAIFDGIKLLNINAELEGINSLKKEDEVIRDIKKSFYSLLLLEEQVKLYQYNYNELEKRYIQSKENYKMGYIDELTLLEVQVSLENFKPGLNNLRELYEISIKNFQNSIGTEENIELIGDINTKPNSYNDLKIFDLLDKNLDIKSIDQNISLLETQISLKKHSSFFPVLGVTYSMSTALNDPFERDNWDINNYVDDMGSFTLFLSMSLDPLLPNSKERIEIEKLNNSIEIAELGKKELIQGLDLALLQQIQIMENSIELQKSLNDTVKLANKRLELTKTAYSQGSKELLEVESAENELRKAQLELLSEKYNYLAATFDIEYMLSTQGE